MASLLATTALTLLRRDDAKDAYQAARDYRDACTLATCPLSDSYWGYVPSLPANALFAALFGLSLLAFIVQSILSRRFLGFSIAMVSGGILEVLGYAGRIISHGNPFSENGFLIQIVCLTIAPAFYAAGIYLCLSRIVTTFGPANSRIPPLWYPRIFIPCDVVSLLLQAGGGGWASVATHAGQSAEGGDHIMQAGLAFQVLTLLIFMCLATDFALKTARRYKSLGAQGAFDESHAALRGSWKFRGFLVVLSFATLCIFTRSVYRVAELSEGWSGHLIKTQRYFIGLEGAIVSAGILGLNFFHPGFCFREGDEARSALGRRRKGEKVSETNSDGEVGVVTEPPKHF